MSLRVPVKWIEAVAVAAIATLAWAVQLSASAFASQETAVHHQPRDFNAVAYEEVIEHYPVTGQSIEAIGRQLRVRGPRFIGIAGAVGSHTPHFDFSYQRKTTASGCRVGKTDFKLRSILKIPEWRFKSGRPNRSIAAAMKRYQALVLKHEQTHARIALTFMERVHARLLALPSQRDCTTLSGLVKIIINEERLRERREQTAFHRSEKNICLPRGSCPEDRGKFRHLSAKKRGELARVNACRKRLGMSDGYGVVRLSKQEFERRCGR